MITFRRRGSEFFDACFAVSVVGDRMELKAPPSGELLSQVVPVKAPDVPAAFGPAAAIMDETGELSTHPAEPQLLFQPVRPPSPPPKPQLVFSDEVGKSSQLFIDITNSHFNSVFL